MRMDLVPRLEPSQESGGQSRRRADLLAVEHLCAGYWTDSGYVEALRDVNLSVQRGEVLGVAGESGSGKSTLVHAMLRLLKLPGTVQGGRVWLNLERLPIHGEGDQRFFDRDSPVRECERVELLSLPSEELRRLRLEEIAVVFQSAMNSLNPVVTVHAQLADAFLAHRPGSSRAQVNDRIAEVLEMVAIPAERQWAFPFELSGGMRQRMCIASALLLEPSLLVLDEPTTGLDVVVQRGILDTLMALRDDLQIAMIIITHDLPLLLEISDNIAIMYAGSVVERAQARSCYTSPLHPYTQRLRHAFPSLVGPVVRLEGIPGEAPDLRMQIGGCMFVDRCLEAKAVCRVESPELLETDSHAVRCHLYPNVASISQALDGREE